MKLPFALFILFWNSCGFTSQAHAHGPFPIKRTEIKKMTFTMQMKLEKPTLARELAEKSTDKKIKIKTEFESHSKGLERAYKKGAILQPLTVASDNIIIPKGVIVTFNTSIEGKLSIGRFAYLGNAPRFSSENLEMVASKMGHTLRVKAWVTQDLVNQYEFHLINRFMGFFQAFSDKTLHFERMQSIEKLALTATDPDLKKWYTVASYYSKHALENPASDIYAQNASDDDYKKTILTSMLRYLMNNRGMSLQDGINLFSQYKSSPIFFKSRSMQAKALFFHHLGHRFAATPGVGKNSDRLGYLSFVYPIAIDVNGPFELPATGFKKFPEEYEPEDQTVVNGRWWSNLWEDEFGGFPFMPITEDGVAFHGPITLFSPKENADSGEAWFLRRDNVSHSCMRMDPNDILELRVILPENLSRLQGTGKTIPLKIIEWPDVTDLKGDGKLEVADVAYYTIPSDGGDIGEPSAYLPEKYNQTYWKRFFGPYSGQLASENTFKVKTNLLTGKNEGVFKGLPKYEVKDQEMVIKGFYEEEIPIMTLPMRPTSIIQYREDQVEYSNPYEGGIDNYGKYPPSYFSRFY